MKILKGAIYKGLFDGELRYFFCPNKECQHDFVAHSQEKLHLLILTILYSGIKRGYEKFSFVFPGTLDVEYPVTVEGCDVRAVHSPTFSEQAQVATMVELWYKKSKSYFQVKRIHQELFR
jgi:hypothetical protein